MYDCVLRLACRSVHLSVYLIGLPVLCGQKVRTSAPSYLCDFRRSSPVLCTKLVCLCVYVYLDQWEWDEMETVQGFDTVLICKPLPDNSVQQAGRPPEIEYTMHPIRIDHMKGAHAKAQHYVESG